MDKALVEKLSSSSLFKGHSSDETADLLSKIQYQLRKFNQGNILVSRGEICQALLIILKGSVRGEMLDFKGKVIEIEVIEAPRPLAPAFLFGNQNTFPVDVVAIDDVIVLWIPRNALIRLFQMSPILLTNYLNIISNRAQFLSEKLWFMSFKSIREKIASYILSLSEPDQDILSLPKNLQELSSFFGVTRPALSRIFSTLKRENILSYKRKKITILNRKKLTEILGDD